MDDLENQVETDPVYLCVCVFVLCVCPHTTILVYILVYIGGKSVRTLRTTHTYICVSSSYCMYYYVQVTYICICICIYIHMYKYVCMYIYISALMCVCVFVCVCVLILLYQYTYLYTQVERVSEHREQHTPIYVCHQTTVCTILYRCI